MSDDEYEEFERTKREVFEELAKLDAQITPQYNKMAQAYHELTTSDEPPHPWTVHVPIHMGTLKAFEYVVQGVIAAGFVLIGGERSVGKTTSLLPLFMRTAHLCREKDPLKPSVRRRVLYVTEDVEQAMRVIQSYRMTLREETIAGTPGRRFTDDEVSDVFKLIQASRMAAMKIVEVMPQLQRLYLPNKCADGSTYLAAPLVVLDTLAANIVQSEENSNAEASGIIAAIRQGMPEIPIVVIAHSPKRSGNTDAALQTVRGASAWEADVQQVAYLIYDEATEKRYLVISGHAKRRFASDIDQIEFELKRHEIITVDKLGRKVTETIMHSEPTPMRNSDRARVKIEAEEAKAKEVEQQRRGRAIEACEAAWRAGNPMSIDQLAKAMGGRKETARATIDQLMYEQLIVPVFVPSMRRTNPNRSSYLVNLDAGAHRDRFRNFGELPDDRAVEWPSWWKPLKEAQ